ncbi:hypothetical protein [Lysinibacillus piscis]|uniref:hypothetical protein n=1 Tax=Lysinibacillus piscis TaxID=2518931 RepID=UPI00222F9A80|nr:hypothetical protein [Lysinibacillus sp. KH24]
MPMFTSIEWVSKRLYLLLTLRFRTKKIVATLHCAFDTNVFCAKVKRQRQIKRYSLNQDKAPADVVPDANAFGTEKHVLTLRFTPLSHRKTVCHGF